MKAISSTNEIITLELLVYKRNSLVQSLRSQKRHHQFKRTKVFSLEIKGRPTFCLQSKTLERDC